MCKVIKIRPIIGRFVCREDRDLVFNRENALQESRRFQDASTTADYAKAIQAEPGKLRKALYKARDRGDEAKVVGRWLYIGEQTCNSRTE